MAKTGKEPSPFGRVLRQIRLEKGLTIKQLAFACGMQDLAIQRLETAESTNPKLETLARLATALGLSPGELVDLVLTHPPTDPL